MSVFSYARTGLLAATACCGTLGMMAHASAATTDSQISSIEKQIRALQGELQHMKTNLKARDAEVKAARDEAARAHQMAMHPVYLGGNGMGYASNTQPAGTPYLNVDGTPHTTMPKLGQGTFQVGGVSVTLGGFVEAAGIFRSRTQYADVSSDFNSNIQYPNSPNYHSPEFRETARQSRLSILMQGNPNAVTNLAGYYEMDFQSSGSSSNSRQSNSYTLRVRNLYATYFRKDWDFEFLGGQNWSMLVMNKTGIKERQEDTPLTIDASYVPGFTWKRQMQFRFVKGFDQSHYHVGLSIEEPQANFTNATDPAFDGTVTYNGSGVVTNNSATTYTADIAPDIIAKVAADPGYGHYEIYGVARFLHTRTTLNSNGANHNVLAGGGGAGMILPIVKGKLDFQASALVGSGIGSYGAAGLPDATVTVNGAPQPLPEWQALAGVIYHPTKAWDLYGYVGTEQIMRSESFNYAGSHYGYGNALYVNSGCETEGTGTCTANTSGITQGTLGFWWRFLKGPFGTMQTGFQYSYTKREIFKGVGGDPSTDINMALVSFRYLPFQ